MMFAIVHPKPAVLLYPFSLSSSLSQSLPLYKTLWDLVWSTSSTVQDTWAYKKAMELGYPYLAPVADPVVSNITNSKYLKQLQSHLQPVKTA